MPPRPHGPGVCDVTIMGAGPAGLLLGCLLQASGMFSCTVLERHERSHIESRPRAGLLEHRTVELLRRHGLADRLLREGLPHNSCEFRIDGHPVTVEFGPRAGGTQWVWPQQELVTDLVAAFLGRGGIARFGVADTAIRDVRARRPVVSFTSADGPVELSSDFVIGADGFHGISRSAVPPGAVRQIDHEHEFGWLALLAQAAPSSPHSIYAIDGRHGFAGHMLRSATITRFYLQCGRDDTTEQWPDDRVWAELRARLTPAHDPTWHLNEGDILEKEVLRMRSHVNEPMQFGRLFLIGDAAHIVTPVGAKGMNLALNDARVLAEALLHWAVDGDERLLALFSSECLRRVWQCQAFSHHLTQLLHRPDPTLPDAAFRTRLQAARLQELLGSDPELTAFARAYVGV